jgi:hypothetical protein
MFPPHLAFVQCSNHGTLDVVRTALRDIVAGTDCSEESEAAFDRQLVANKTIGEASIFMR